MIGQPSLSIPSANPRRNGCTNSLGEIGCVIGGVRRLVDQGAPSQLVKRQRRVYPAGGVEVAVYQTVEDMTNVKPPDPSSSIRVADDVDRAAVAQQVIELRPIGELIDPGEVDQQQPACIVGRCVETIEVHRLAAVVGAHAHEVSLVTHNVDQLKLLEEGGDGREALADLRACLD